jgi:hypothetical protein
VRFRTVLAWTFVESGKTSPKNAATLPSGISAASFAVGYSNSGRAFDPALPKHLSPLGWEHIDLTGDYQWHNTAKLGGSKFRPLRQRSRTMSSVF